MKIFCKNIELLLVVNYFPKKLHHRCLTGNTPLYCTCLMTHSSPDQFLKNSLPLITQNCFCIPLISKKMHWEKGWMSLLSEKMHWERGWMSFLLVLNKSAGWIAANRRTSSCSNFCRRWIFEVSSKLVIKTSLICI